MRPQFKAYRYALNVLGIFVWIHAKPKRYLAKIIERKSFQGIQRELWNIKLWVAICLYGILIYTYV